MEECCNCGCEVYEDEAIWDDDGQLWCEECADLHDIASADKLDEAA